VIRQRRIDERFLTIESLCGATTRETVSIKVNLSHFGEEFGNRSQPELVPPIPSVQRGGTLILQLQVDLRSRGETWTSQR